jgi:hypothetical protein
MPPTNISFGDPQARCSACGCWERKLPRPPNGEGWRLVATYFPSASGPGETRFLCPRCASALARHADASPPPPRHRGGGLARDKRTGCYHPHITDNDGRRRWLGFHATYEEAMDALVAARLELTPPLDRDPADVSRGGKKFVKQVQPHPGVIWDKHRAKWRAGLQCGGVRRFVYCETAEGALEALAWLKATSAIANDDRSFGIDIYLYRR